MRSLKINYVIPDGTGTMITAFPPLGISVLRAMTPKAIRGYELIATCHHDRADGAYSVANEQPDVLAVSATTSSVKRGYKLISECKNTPSWQGNRIVTLMGGPHPTALPLEALNYADAVVLGETPPVLLHAVLDWAVQQLECGSDETRLFVHRGDRKSRLIERRPVPDRSWCNPDRYLTPAAIQTSSGCSFDCGFCSVNSIQGRRWRHVDYRDLELEIARLPGCRRVAVVDDNFLPSSEGSHAKRVSALMKEHGVRWGTEATAITLYNNRDELIPLFSSSGCEILYIGVESIESKLPKCVPLRAYPDLVAQLHDHGISVGAFFVFGLGEDETPEIFEKTVAWAEKTRFDIAEFFVNTPRPGARDFDYAVRDGQILDWDWDHYGSFHPVRRFAHFTPETMYRGVRDAWKWFYESRKSPTVPPTGLQRLLRDIAKRYQQQNIHDFPSQKMPSMEPSPNPFVMRQLELGSLHGDLLERAARVSEIGIPMTVTTRSDSPP